VQEAQAMELPVIVSDVGGIKFGLLPNESGFVIKEGDIDAFAKAVEKLILNPNLKAKMGKNGRGFVCTFFDSRVLVSKLLSIYYRA